MWSKSGMTTGRTGHTSMRAFAKKDFPVSKIRRFLEPGPIVLVSSAWKGKTNIMTMGWHMVMGFEPSLIGCYIWDQNHSFGMIKGSKECAINIPTFDIAPQVVGIGNCSAQLLGRRRRQVFEVQAYPGGGR